MKKPILILIAAILCLCFWFLLIRGCNKPGPDHSGDKSSVDSIVEKAMKDSLVWEGQRDSIFKIVRYLQTGKDSLAKIIATYKVDLHKQGQDIQGLLDELDKAEADKDTAGYVRGCDSLRNEFATAKGLVLHYMSANDSLASTNTHILTQKDTIIGRLSLLYSDANNQLFDVSRRYNLLYGDYQKLNKPAKRFGIGPFLGMRFAGGKVVGTVGIGVTYNLFKF